MAARVCSVVMTLREPGLNEVLKLMFQAHPWHGIDTYAGEAEVVHAFIEIVPSDPVKYELDKGSGHLWIDRPQRFSSLPPTLYGFVPQTFCGPRVGARCRERTKKAVELGDGDPIDICVLTEKTVRTGNFLARAKPIGGLRLIDGDQADDKIVAVLVSDLAYGHYSDIGDCPKPLLERLQHYFLTYKQRPGSTATVEIAEVYERQEALETIAESVADYRERFGAPEARLELLERLLRRE